jgi:hypothetical protein
MTMSPALPYQVSWSTGSVESIKRQNTKLASPEERKQLGRKIRAIHDRLREDPLNFGEVYRTRGAIAAFLAVKNFVSVDYSVDTVRKLVHVKNALFFRDLVMRINSFFRSFPTIFKLKEISCPAKSFITAAKSRLPSTPASRQPGVKCGGMW